MPTTHIHHPSHTPEVHEQPDSWHRHTPAEGEPQHEHAGTINTAALAATFVAMGLGIVLTVGVIAVYFFSYATELRATQIETTAASRDFNAYRAGAESSLSSYGWSDPAADRLHIPISQAMDRVVTQYQAAAPAADSPQPGTGGHGN